VGVKPDLHLLGRKVTVFESGAEENIWTKKVEVRGERRELQNDKLYDFFSSSDFIRVIN
jgi:hypothetical protein